jgi:hypothetical protein
MDSFVRRIVFSSSATKDIPSAELHLLDTGHFALKEEVDRIGSLMHEFLDRTMDKIISTERASLLILGLSLAKSSI